MLVERLKLFATLTSKRSAKLRSRTLRRSFGAAISIAALSLALHGLTMAVATTPAVAAGHPCGASGEMLTKGLDAYSQTRYESAIPMFECVLRSDDGLAKLHAEFFLARVYSDDTSGFTDHARAYTLFQSISEQADTVDPDDARRAPFVAKSVTAIAGYVRRGLPVIGLKSDLERAVEYYRTAATTFNEPDAQFEIGKLHLTGTGVPTDTSLGLHYIQKLVQEGHAGAQAYLAEQHWRGTLPQVSKDHARALAMSKIAVENAGASDRLWIEDGYQNMYCGTSAGERVRAAEIATSLRRAFARAPGQDRLPQISRQAAQPPMSLGRRQPTPSRTCSNGEAIDMDLRASLGTPPLASSLTQTVPQHTTPAGMRPPAR